MTALVKAIRELGVRQMRRLNRARRWGWEGLLRGHVVTRVVQTLLDAGVFDELHAEGRLDVDAFAARQGLDARLLRALCDYLAARRLLCRSDDGSTYSLDANGELLVEGTLRGWMELTRGYENVLHAMPELLRKTRHYGTDIVRDGHDVAVGSGRASSEFFFPLTATRISRAGYRCVLDIGCGDATFLRYLCSKVPGVKGVGIDRSPDAIAAARDRICREGLSDRITVLCGDMTTLADHCDDTREVDAATAFFVLHELLEHDGTDVIAEFLHTFRCALPGVPLIAIEPIRPSVEEMRRRPGPAIEYALLHDLSDQVTMPRGAWTKVLAAAGFGAVDVEHCDFARSSTYIAV